MDKPSKQDVTGGVIDRDQEERGNRGVYVFTKYGRMPDFGSNTRELDYRVTGQGKFNGPFAYLPSVLTKKAESAPLLYAAGGDDDLMSQEPK